MRFYPRHPRGWRHVKSYRANKGGKVSIHATLAGGDDVNKYGAEIAVEFLSTPPSRVATGIHMISTYGYEVSIHATLAGGDPTRHFARRADGQFLSTPPSRVATINAIVGECVPHCFYPRHPRGWRLPCGCCVTVSVEFLSTPPSRVATCFRFAPFLVFIVSIHATLAGGD